MHMPFNLSCRQGGCQGCTCCVVSLSTQALSQDSVKPSKHHATHLPTLSVTGAPGALANCASSQCSRYEQEWGAHRWQHNLDIEVAAGQAEAVGLRAKGVALCVLQALGQLCLAPCILHNAVPVATTADDGGTLESGVCSRTQSNIYLRLHAHAVQACIAHDHKVAPMCMAHGRAWPPCKLRFAEAFIHLLCNRAPG